MLAAACGRFDFDATPDGSRDGIRADTTGGDPTLVAYYPMDSLTAGVVPDATGHGHDGSCSGTGCPGLIAGRIGSGALVFDGVDDIIEVAGPASVFGTTAWTIAWWMRLQSLPPSVWCPVNKLFGSADTDTWQMVMLPAGSIDFVTETTGAPGTDDASATPPNLTDNLWHHYAFTFDGTTKLMYFDGSQVAGDVPATAPQFDDGLITLGSDLDNGSPKGQVMGDLDDVRIYSIALTQAEVTQLVNVP